jgi:FG-GAP-like repeat
MGKISMGLVGAALALQALTAQAQYSAEFIETAKAWGSVVADFNGDGHDDIFITGHDTDDRIWYWTPNGYVPSAQTLVWVDRHDCDAADFDRDGRLDMYCAVGAERGEGTGPKELWLQDALGVFKQVAGHGAEDVYGSGRIPVFLDANHDGYPDLYLTNERRERSDGHLSVNRLFINQRGTGFKEAAVLPTGEHGSACAAKGDVDGDGWDDLVVCDLEGPPHIYLNNQAGDFVESASPAVVTKWVAAKLVDMNQDGRDDLVLIGAGNKLQIWLNTGAAPYFVTPAFENQLTYIGKSLTVGDFNKDGRKDVYVVMMKTGCQANLQDEAPDVVFQALGDGTWTKIKQTQAYAGCGHLADTVDGSRVLLMNGGISWVGPNYVLSWVP